MTSLVCSDPSKMVCSDPPRVVCSDPTGSLQTFLEGSLQTKDVIDGAGCTLLIKFLYWTSDQKAIKLDNVGHIHCESSGSTHLPIGFQLGFSWNF